MLRGRLLPPAVFLGGALAFIVVAVVTVSLLLANGSPASAQDDNETKVPAKPTGLSVATEQGSLDVLADWDDVEGADDYLVRWRPNDGKLNDGARVASSSASITVAAYGEWVVRVQACNDAGCGKPLAERFSVEPAPEPTPTPTPNTTNKPPVFDRNNIRFHTVLENYGPLITAGNYVVRDPENDQITLSLAGTDAASFATHQFWGGSELNIGLDLNATPDYESPDDANGDGVYEVTIQATDADGSGETTELDVTVTVLDVDEAPVIDDQAERYLGFTGTDNAPRGTLVSKIYDGIFSDPDGDELTYTVSVPADRSELVDTVYVLEDIPRVFIRLGAEDDWGAVTPALPKPLVTTVTLTATDPGGLSASVTGEFRTNWEQNEILAVCDRTTQVRDALVELLGKACENIGADDLAPVVKLDLSNRGLRSLRTEDFSGMSSLRDVDASNNSFTSWTAACAGSFGDTVQNVNLTNNKLGGTTGARVPPGCFTAAKFPDLRALHLAATRINLLTGNPFDGLTKLEYLDLSQNQITAVPVGAFEDLSELWYLDLGRNALTSSGLPVTTSGSVVTGAVFDDLSSLEWLALNNQKAHDASDNFEPTGNPTLTTLNAHVFKGLSSLKELDLAHNGFTATSPNVLPNGVFTPLTSLESLALFGNSGAPWTATQLTTLGVRSEASVIQSATTPPTGFTVEHVSTGVKLSWDKPSGTGINHEYRALTPDGTGSIGWTDISSPTDNDPKLEHTVSSSDMTSGKNYFFQLRSENSGNHSWHANADWSVNFGTSGNNTLTGTHDPDWIVGLAGDDTLKGGYGADKLDGGDGTDTASYAGSAHGVRVSLSITTQQDENEPLSAARGDVLSNIENITGSGGRDTLTGDANANVINGGAGDDVIEGGAGADTMTGGAGTDTLSYANSVNSVWVDIGSTPEIKSGDAQGDSVSGFENLIGSTESDILIGDGNDNVIIGNGRADELDGGGGTDTVSYAASDDSVTVNFAGGNFGNKRDSDSSDRRGGGGHAEGNIISGFENAIGSAYPDWFIPNAAGNKIDGGDSIDDGKSTIYFPKADTWRPGNSDEGVDNQQEFAHSLGDVVYYRGSGAGVTVNLTTGTNTGGYAQGDTLTGIESIVGSDHVDTLTGDENNNTFFGLKGGDTFDGKGGTDTVDYSWSVHGVTNFNAKSDTLMVLDLKTPANNTWHAAGDTFTNIEWIIGSMYNDKITGGDGNNRLAGGAGKDIIRGGNGDDTLWGPDPWTLRRVGLVQYYDQLFGGAGNDHIIVGAGDHGKGEADNDKFLVVSPGWSEGGGGTDEYYFHRNYFPAGTVGNAAQIVNYEDNEKIWICFGTGKGTGELEVSWTTTVEEVAGQNTIDDIVVTVSLQSGTDSLNQGTFIVLDYTDTTKVDIAWSDPNAAVGTGCNFVDLGSVPGRNRMIRGDVSDLIVPLP